MKAVCLLTICLASSIASAGLVPVDPISIGLFNTGVNDDGSKISDLPPGNEDPHWQVISKTPWGSSTATTGDFPAYAIPENAAYNSATGVYPVSNWIWVEDTATSTIGTFIFELKFNLDGYLPGQTSITGNWGTDNYGSISLNGFTGADIGTGTLAFTTVDADHFNDVRDHTFTLYDEFRSGWNSLQVTLVNPEWRGAESPGALMVNFLEVQSMAIPEPSALLASLTIGSLGLLFLRRRR